jgi:hypothetical protein
MHIPPPPKNWLKKIPYYIIVVIVYICLWVMLWGTDK